MLAERSLGISMLGATVRLSSWPTLGSPYLQAFHLQPCCGLQALGLSGYYGALQYHAVRFGSRSCFVR
jgi:hypothetical protein